MKPTALNRLSRPSSCDSCIIGKLLSHSFSQRPLSEKYNIFAEGNRRPDLKTISFKGRYFFELADLFSTYDWLTLCEKTQQLYCWPCLLFSTESRSKTWNTNRLCHIKKVEEQAKIHDLTLRHAGNVAHFHLFRQQYLDSLPQSPDETLRDLNVTKDELGKLVDSICIALVKGDKHSWNSMLDSITKVIDQKIQNLHQSKLWSRDYSNLVIGTLHKCVTEKIKDEISKSSFVSLIINKINSVSSVSFYAIIFRYIDENELVQERLVDISNVSTDELKMRLAQCVESLNVGNKLISISADGCSCKETKQILTAIKREFEHLLIVPCHNHRFDLMLQNHLRTIPSCKNFFQTMTKLVLFFYQSKRRKDSYLTLIKVDNCPDNLPSFMSFFLESIETNHATLLGLLHEMFSDSRWDRSTGVEAKGLHETLETFDFVFHLIVFNRIMTIVEKIEPISNSYLLRPSCTDSVKTATEKLKRLSIDFDSVSFEVMKIVDLDNFYDKDTYNFYQSLFSKIVTAAVTLVEDVYGELNQLQFLELLNSANINDYSQSFPENCFTNLVDQFSHFFEVDRLKRQLVKVYAERDCRSMNVAQLFTCFNRTNMVLNEVVTLANLVLTLPLSKPNGNSAQAKINAYLVNFGHVLSKKSLLIIEKDILQRLWKQIDFYNKM